MSGHYAYTFSSDVIDPIVQKPDWAAYEQKALKQNMWYYTPAVHIASFQLPAFVDRVIGRAATERSSAEMQLKSRERFMGLVMQLCA